MIVSLPLLEFCMFELRHKDKALNINLMITFNFVLSIIMFCFVFCSVTQAKFGCYPQYYHSYIV